MPARKSGGTPSTVIEPPSLTAPPFALSWQSVQSPSAGALATAGASVFEAGAPAVLAYATAAQAMIAATATR